MPRRLVYLPIEPYKERYTEYLSTSGGVFESQVRKLGIVLTAIRPSDEIRTIKTGAVLDGYGRAEWAFQQTLELMNMMRAGKLNPASDVIYIEDFWHPGFEMIPYMQTLVYGYDTAKHVPVYAFSHAQSTDPYDFTYDMRGWMRPMEKGWINYLTGIFCAAKEMVVQFRDGGLLTGSPPSVPHKMFPVGQPFDGALLKSRFPVCKDRKRKLVVYSSRLDSEKNPRFLIEVMLEAFSRDKEIKFTICSGRDRLNSNDAEAIYMLLDLRNRYPDQLSFSLGLKKKDYFQLLQWAKVQLNTADQDFVSYTLLEATLHGCAPLYPSYLTFPDALNRQQSNLYTRLDVIDCVDKLEALMKQPEQDYSWVYKKHESTVHRMVQRMGFDVPDVRSISELNTSDIEQLVSF